MSLRTGKILTAEESEAAMRAGFKGASKKIKRAGGIEQYRRKSAKTQKASEPRPRALDRLPLGSWFQGGNG